MVHRQGAWPKTATANSRLRLLTWSAYQPTCNDGKAAEGRGGGEGVSWHAGRAVGSWCIGIAGRPCPAPTRASAGRPHCWCSLPPPVSPGLIPPPHPPATQRAPPLQCLTAKNAAPMQPPTLPQRCVHPLPSLLPSPTPSLTSNVAGAPTAKNAAPMHLPLPTLPGHPLFLT